MGLPISQPGFDAEAYLAWEAAQADTAEPVEKQAPQEP